MAWTNPRLVSGALHVPDNIKLSLDSKNQFLPFFQFHLTLIWNLNLGPCQKICSRWTRKGTDGQSDAVLLDGPTQVSYFLTILIKPLPRLFYRGKINKYILFYVVHSFLYVKSPIKYQILFHSLIRILENKQYVIKTVDNTNKRPGISSSRVKCPIPSVWERANRTRGTRRWGVCARKNLYECIENS